MDPNQMFHWLVNSEGWVNSSIMGIRLWLEYGFGERRYKNELSSIDTEFHN